MVLESDSIRTIYYYFLVRPTCLETCYEYFVNNVPPSVISHKYMIDRLKVRHCISRVKSSRMNNVIEEIKRLYMLKSFNIIDLFDDGYRYRCMWCGRIFGKRRKNTFALHVSHQHIDELKKFINSVFEGLQGN
ncbi:MAG: hypothetical protein QXZ63_07570 [Sulfolobales archaeon]